MFWRKYEGYMWYQKLVITTESGNMDKEFMTRTFIKEHIKEFEVSKEVLGKPLRFHTQQFYCLKYVSWYSVMNMNIFINLKVLYEGY